MCFKFLLFQFKFFKITFTNTHKHVLLTFYWILFLLIHTFVVCSSAQAVESQEDEDEAVEQQSGQYFVMHE